MARRKASRIPDALLDQLLAGADPKTAFDANGLLDDLKKALAERALNAEMDHHRACQEFRVRAAILDLKEVPDGTTQSFPHSRRAPRPASGWSRSQNGF
jgi:hypothetical protein